MAHTAPLLGVAGTLMALLELEHGPPTGPALGPAAVATLAATCYGLLLSALCFRPLAGKVRTLDGYERLVRDQMITGLLAIRLGQNPEYVQTSLQAFAQRHG
jgi:flagellar motor component MotA